MTLATWVRLEYISLHIHAYTFRLLPWPFKLSDKYLLDGEIGDDRTCVVCSWVTLSAEETTCRSCRSCISFNKIIVAVIHAILKGCIRPKRMRAGCVSHVQSDGDQRGVLTICKFIDIEDYSANLIILNCMVFEPLSSFHGQNLI